MGNGWRDNGEVPRTDLCHENGQGPRLEGWPRNADADYAEKAKEEEMKIAVTLSGETYRLEKDEIDGGTAHFGTFVEHVIDGLRLRTQYVVVHRGTCGTIAVVGTKQAAIRLMASLESLPVNWGFRKKSGKLYEASKRYLSELPKAERRKLKAVYDRANDTQ